MITAPTPPRRPGRPAVLSQRAVVEAGLHLGMRRLSIRAVAAQLGVPTATLYGYVRDLGDLTELVGDALLASLAIPCPEGTDWDDYLCAFGLEVCEIVVANPGLGSFLLSLPRASNGLRELIDQAATHLTDRGLAPVDAVLDAATVVWMSVWFGERVGRVAGSGRHELPEAVWSSVDVLEGQCPTFRSALSDLRQMDPREHFTWILRCFVAGLSTKTALAGGMPSLTTADLRSRGVGSR